MNRPAADLPDGLLEGELRAAFSAATTDLAPTTDPWARTRRAVARSRARRRAGGLAGVAVAAVVALVAVVHPPARHDPQPARPEVTDVDVRTWPTRGDLAGRADLLAAVSAKAADGGQRRIVSVPYLGTVDELTVALVLADGVGDGDDPGRRAVVVYGRPSVPVERWRIDDAELQPADIPVLSATIFDGGEWSRGVALTLSRGVRVAWSPRPFADASGRAVRSYVPLTLDDGVGAWRTRWKAGRVLIRAERGQQRALLRPTVQAVEDDDSAGNPSTLAPEPAPSCARDGSYADLALSGLSGAWREAAVRYAAVTGVRMIWCGRVGTEQAVLVGVATNDGTDFQVLTEKVTRRDGEEQTSTAWPVPAGRALDYPMAGQLLVDLRRNDDQAGGERDAVTVVAPGAVTAELQQGDPTYTFGVRKLTGDGYARIALSESDTYRWRDYERPAQCVFRDVHGNVLARIPSLVKDRWGDELDGPDAPNDAAPRG